MQNNKYLGNWVVENGDGFETFNVIEIDGQIARAVNKNIPLSELGTKYKRPDEVMPNPFLNTKVGMPEITRKPDPVINKMESQEISVDPLSEATSLVQHSKPAQTPTPTPEKIKLELQDPEEQLILNAIQLSKSSSTLKLNLNVELSFDFDKIKFIAESMEIDGSKVVNAMLNYLGKDTEYIFNAVKADLSNRLGVVQKASQEEVEKLEE